MTTPLKKLLDREWRLANLWYIKDRNQKVLKFKKNRSQEDFDNKRYSRNIILKSRRLGFTTLETTDTIDETFFTPNFDALFIAQDLVTAMDIFSNKIEFAYDHILQEFKDAVIIDKSSARKLRFNLGSKEKPVYSSVTVDSSGRSGTYRRVHITEFGYICKHFPEKAHEIIAGTIPAVPIDGRVDIESTADGSDGIFHDMFWEAWNRGEPTLPTQYKAHFYNWTWDDEEIDHITDAQIKEFLQSDDYKLFKQYQLTNNLSDDEITYYYLKWLSLNKNWPDLHREYPTTPEEAFASSGNKMFDSQKLSELKTIEPIAKEGDLFIYEQPRAGHRYAIAADVAEGVGRDSSTMAVYDFTPTKPKIVAIYKNNKIAPDLFAYELKNVGTKYQWAVIAPERNNHGHAVIAILRTIYPEKLIYGYDQSKNEQKLGWQTNLVTKPKMFYDLNTAVNNEVIDIPSRIVISEMLKYEKEDVRVKNYDEEATNHFDLLTAVAIGFQLKDYFPEKSASVVINLPEGY